MKQHRSSGITLIELLVGMAVLGIILGVATYFLTSTGRLTSHQDQLATSAADVRLALFRISEVTRQAGYIYPPGVEITVTDHGTVTTGESALALLAPEGSTYCLGTGSVYCGFIYYVGSRNAFVPPLSSAASTPFALGEIRVTGIAWNKNVVPGVDITAWPAGVAGLLADGAMPAATNLGGDVRLSTLEAIYDDPVQFRYAGNSVSNRSLLNGVNVGVQVRRNSINGSADSAQSIEIFTRSVPRSAPVNLQ